MSALKRLVTEESGQGLAEYGLILGLVAVVVVGVLFAMGGKLSGIFGKVNAELDKAPVGGE